MRWRASPPTSPPASGPRRRSAKLNAELEQRVRERTAELETANRELEAFAYSVSHDLRAPLRAIDGFSAVCSRSYADRLDEDGRRLPGADHVQRGQRMGQLIDDLLRLSRADPHRAATASQSTSARWPREIIEELARRRAGPPGRGRGHPRPRHARGDPHLLRLVLDNLLGNAWKFTGKCEHAAIERRHDRPGRATRCSSCATTAPGSTCATPSKLFDAVPAPAHAPTTSRAPASGWPSCTVSSRRHGGRIWAESELGKGATFFFTITSSSADAEPS